MAGKPPLRQVFSCTFVAEPPPVGSLSNLQVMHRAGAYFSKHEPSIWDCGFILGDQTATYEGMRAEALMMGSPDAFLLKLKPELSVEDNLRLALANN